MSGTPRALIVGAGIAGLALASRLARSGWETVVVEKEAAPPRGGFATLLNRDGFGAADRMNLLGTLTERRVAPVDLVSLRSDGTVRSSIAAGTLTRIFGRDAVCVLREDLADALHAVLGGQAELRFGTTVAELEQEPERVRVGFGDGSAEAFDLVVAADGARSSLRRMVFGREDGAGAPILKAAVMLTREPREVPANTLQILDLPGRKLVVLRADGHPTSCLLMCRTHATSAAPTNTVAVLRHAFEGAGGPAPAVLDELERTPPVYVDSGDPVRLTTWCRGRVVLLGDAAWHLGPAAGHGADLALAGAYRLGLLLQDRMGHLPSVLQLWDKQMRPIVEREQARARRGTGLAWARLANVHPMTHVLRRRLRLPG